MLFYRCFLQLNFLMYMRYVSNAVISKAPIKKVFRMVNIMNIDQNSKKPSRRDKRISASKVRQQKRIEYEKKRETEKRNKLSNASPSIKKAEVKKLAKKGGKIESKYKKQEQKRKEAYDNRVWKGWRNTDGKKYPVVTYNLDDVKKPEDDENLKSRGRKKESLKSEESNLN